MLLAQVRGAVASWHPWPPLFRRMLLPAALLVLPSLSLHLGTTLSVCRHCIYNSLAYALDSSLLRGPINPSWGVVSYLVLAFIILHLKHRPFVLHN